MPGLTTLALARAILDRNDLQVVTNDFEITQLLIDASQCGVIHTGGTLCRENRSCVGESAARNVTPPGYRYGLYLRQRLGQSRDIHP